MTANIIRLLILAGYLAGLYFLRRYLRENPPRFPGDFVYPCTRTLKAIWYLASMLLGPVAALIWLGGNPVASLPMTYTLMTLPIGILIWGWLWRYGIRISPEDLEDPDSINVFPFVIFFLLLPIIALIATLFLLQDRLPVILPALVFAFAPPAFMLFLIYLWAPRILPLSEKEQETHHKDALKLLASFWTTFSKPDIFVINGEAQTRVKGNAFLGVNPGLIVTEPENAVVLRDGSKILNIIGPGIFFVGYEDYAGANVVHEVLDLQKQFRVEKEVPAITKDGIAVLAPISSMFHIGGARPPGEPGQKWEYHKSAAFKAFAASEVNPEGRTPLEAHLPHSWKDIPMQVAQARLKQLIAHYTLDEIYGAKDPAPPQLLRIRMGKEIREYVSKYVEQPFGIKIFGGGMGNKITPVDPQVTRQRIDSWKATLMRQVTINKGKIGAAYLTQLGRVRSRVLSEILTRLIEQAKQLESLGDGSEKKKALVMLLKIRLMETLDDIARDPAVEPLLPETTLMEIKRRSIHAAEDLGGDA